MTILVSAFPLDDDKIAFFCLFLEVSPGETNIFFNWRQILYFLTRGTPYRPIAMAVMSSCFEAARLLFVEHVRWTKPYHSWSIACGHFFLQYNRDWLADEYDVSGDIQIFLQRFVDLCNQWRGGKPQNVEFVVRYSQVFVISKCWMPDRVRQEVVWFLSKNVDFPMNRFCRAFVPVLSWIILLNSLRTLSQVIAGSVVFDSPMISAQFLPLLNRGDWFRG